VLYIGFNSGDEIETYILIDEADFIVTEKNGRHIFVVNAEVKDWEEEGNFEVYVNISEYPHPDEWTPLDDYTEILHVKSSEEPTPIEANFEQPVT
jgi:hypothetical protein